MMSDHELLALRHPRIVEFHKFYSEYRVFFEVARERSEVVIRIFETDDHRFFFEQSHFISTPVQNGDGAAGRVLEDHAHKALARGIESIVTYYEDAVSRGHQPSLDWFVPNPRF